MKAEGQAHHRFWGEYSAVIGLTFKDDKQAQAALYSLPGWRVAKSVPNGVVCVVADKPYEGVLNLNEEIDRLVSFGAKREKILSFKYSVDYGEPFTVDIPHPDELKTEQLEIDL